jgi:uncharacterized protein
MAASSSRARDATVFVSTAALSVAFGGINFGAAVVVGLPNRDFSQLAGNSQTPDERNGHADCVENRLELRQFVSVKAMRLFPLVLALALATGCKKAETVPAKPAADSQEPTQAQPKLPTLKIYLGAETLDAELATTGREITTGMMFRTNVTDESAMLFVFSQPYQPSFWMKNCPDSLSAAYISPDGVIQEIHHLEKYDTNSVVAAAANIQYVLEVNDGWFQRHHVGTGVLIRTEIGSLQETFFRNRQ